MVRVRRTGRARLSAARVRHAKLVVRAKDRWGNSRTHTVRLLLRR
jgi:hypothetical protein